MDLTEPAGEAGLADLAATVRESEVVMPVGSATHWEVGGPPPTGSRVRAPAGVVGYEPDDLTVTVGAGTTCGELAAVLARDGQECPLDPRDPRATIGGVLAAGLSGVRRLRYGPLRDAVLEVRFVTGDGRVVKGGGPTVKNVSGYDLPRLLVGSLGTLGVIGRVTLRCRPRAVDARWWTSERSPAEVRARLHAPSSLLWGGGVLHVLLEGHPDDIRAEAGAAGLRAAEGPPVLPDGPVRGRISVRPRALTALGRALDRVDGCRWLAEAGVGTVHVAADSVAPVLAARTAAHEHGGWLLREAGGLDRDGDGAVLDGFGAGLSNLDVLRRVKSNFDPAGKLSPGRLPL